MPTYFVTGATGFIGRHLLERLLQREGDIHVLVRAGLPREARRDRRAARRRGPDHGRRGRPRAAAARRLRGRPRALRGKVDHFFHLAAIYDITADEVVNALHNVNGTQHAVDLANDLQAGIFHHASSIAVAGTFQGHFTEDMFDEGQSLPTPYHRTKFESEKLVRQRVQGAWRVYRPAIVVGDSRTGEMDKIDGPYYFFKALQKVRHSLPRVVPAGRPRGRLDQHRPRRLGRRGDRPHRARGRPSTARPSTSSTRAPSAPATCSTRSPAPATRRRWSCAWTSG